MITSTTEATALDTSRPDLATLIAEIVHSAESTRPLLIDDFIRATDGMNKGIAAALCRDFKADRNTWLDDFCQYVRMAAFALLDELAADPEKADEVGSYRALLHFRARSAVTKFIDSSAGFNQASGMVGVKRRRREMERTRAHLYSQGVEPTDELIVEETNKRMAATRADYKRQGMECSIEDLQMAETVENIEDHSHPVSVDAVENDSELHSTERHRLVYMCIAACDEESDQLGQIARLWFEPALNDTCDEHPTAAAIAKQVGIEASTARAKVARMKEISRRVARDRFGIRTNETLSA